MRCRLFLLALILGVWGPVSRGLALSQWEVAVLFLGAGESPEYQKDIDRNILELSKTFPGDHYRLSIYRELPTQNVEYFVDRRSAKVQSWDPLFAQKPAVSISVPGELRFWERHKTEKNLLLEPLALEMFLKRAFRFPNSKRILVLYSHGEGYRGLGGGVSLKQLRANLEAALPERPGRALDILWLDACFMANLEAAYELRNTSRFLIASEEAEFSAGAPFDMFESLAWGPDYPYRVAIDFAERFVESYSYLKKGSQRRAVFKSSATVSVLDLRRLEGLVEKVSALTKGIGSFSQTQRANLRKNLPRLTMDRQDLVDFGSLIVHLSRSKSFQSTQVQEAVTQMRFLLDLQRPEKFQTNPRLIVSPSQSGAPIVFGYEEWTKGYRGDADSLEKLPDALHENITAFVNGPLGREWPSREVRDVLYFSPFTVGLNQFHYYYLDSTLLSSFKRTKDFVYFPSESLQNPVVFTGYTQGIGETAERYSGLSILDPTIGLPSFDYADLDFVTATGWGNL